MDKIFYSLSVDFYASRIRYLDQRFMSRSILDQNLNRQLPLCKLADSIDWTVFRWPPAQEVEGMVVDLIAPFRNIFIYYSDFDESYSVKYVMAELVPGLS